MKKAKKTKAPQRRSALDKIATQLRAMQRRQTRNIIEIGKLLLKSRKLLANEHGEWQPWLEKNFDRDYRTAIRYVSAAEYVERKSDTVSLFANLSPTVLYGLARGGYNDEEEAAILAATRKRRIDQYDASAICDALRPPLAADDADQDDSGEDGGDDAPAPEEEDPEIAAILDGPPPKVPDGASEHLALTNFVLRDFDAAITTLKRLMTKPCAQFAQTTHSAGDLEHVEAFIRDVTKAKEPR
jgi:hypothetical protein